MTVATVKMQAATYAGKGSTCFDNQKRRVLPGFSELRKRGLGFNNLRMTERSSCFGLRLGSAAMEAELGRVRTGVDRVFRSSAKARSVRAQASAGLFFSFDLDYGDMEDLVPAKIQAKSSGNVLPYVGVACLGAILFGYHLGVVNGALEYLSKDLGIAENTVIQGNTLLAGATVGSFTGGALADKFGRTKTFQLDAIPLAVGAFLCATAQSVQTMIIGRLLAGIGIGISSAIVPLYISEISPTEIRGTLGSVNQLFICIGILAALVAGLPLAGNPLWWRSMFGIAMIPSVLLALGMAFSPESPRWLYQQGKISQAEMSIKTLFGKEKVAEVMNDLSAASQGSSEPEAGWFDLFSSRYWKVVSVGAALFLFQQLAGINAVVYYSTSVFRSVGIASDVAASALVGASNVFGEYNNSILFDGQARKEKSFNDKLCWNVPALLLPEIFASRIRAKAVALSLGMHWISNFVIGLYFLSVVNKFGISSVYLGFSMVCLLAVIYIASNVVETKGRSLEEIERALNPAI
ncbi:hypothetical protein TEA_028286 [Camellia sinensis var. sinensis]|uniref:Major facilitator superfamily (MFS) profile domain-containing protein n=1 Tax=Camellia sinensis var. sinensis TaxID=542762 RepID=A0A4S4ETG2_CAMSN|nr:hypothetical protein TEA_028286 [Camellia sinensis var. sinensis]